MPNLLHGDCIEEMRKLPENSVDAIVTDPPYGLGFMGKKWDDLPPGLEFAEQALRVLKPGGHLLAFGGTRTYHRLACAIEDAGFEIRDCLAWLYGSGFPKSHDVSKAIDKAAGAERISRVWDSASTRFNGAAGFEARVCRSCGRHAGSAAANCQCKDDPPATPEAAEWQGWGTALKPAHEPIVLARKPLTGTVAANVLGHGTGALNVDGCRVGADGGTRKGSFPNGASVTSYGGGLNGACEIEDIGKGRWPANVVLDPEAGAMLDEQSGELSSPKTYTRNVDAGTGHGGAPVFHPAGSDCVNYGDKGGASRFFYCAKASRRERNAGLEGLPQKSPAFGADKGDGLGRGISNTRQDWPAANVHPTVKPIALMRWLVRMVTPPNGTVLDPFLGSGTTGIAAKLEGFDFIGIERESEYLAIAQARIDHHEPEPEPAQLELAA